MHAQIHRKYNKRTMKFFLMKIAECFKIYHARVEKIQQKHLNTCIAEEQTTNLSSSHYTFSERSFSMSFN